MGQTTIFLFALIFSLLYIVNYIDTLINVIYRANHSRIGVTTNKKQVIFNYINFSIAIILWTWFYHLHRNN